MALTAAVRIEPMTLEDIPVVLEIERASFLTPWPPEAFQQEVLHNRLARYLVARQGGAVVGYLAKQEIARTGQPGAGLAQGGFITGIIAVVLAIIMIAVGAANVVANNT